MNYTELTKRMKAASFTMAALPAETRDCALREIMSSLRDSGGEILDANEKDLKAAESAGAPAPILARLKFDSRKLDDALAGISDLVKLPDPLFKRTLERQLDEGLTLSRVTCPIGVIGVIFESRPDALIQIASLCIKSGNCCILKGGSEAANSNRALFSAVKRGGVKAGLPEGFTELAESRSEIDELLKCHESIDLIIPRGSNSFVRHIMESSSIPVMGHADGICHIYVDKAADMNKAIPVIVDAKTQYVAVCNAVETLLVHREAAAELLPALKRRLDENGVTVRGDSSVMAMTGCEEATEEDYRTEYLDSIIAIRVVDSLEDAVAHINAYGSHHTDCIVTEDPKAAEQFMQTVDSAGVYQNCSTRFADGFRYGFGAEVGVSTGKLHARGPVGLEGLVSYKYRLVGDGHIVADYAEGRKSFDFIDNDIN